MEMKRNILLLTLTLICSVLFIQCGNSVESLTKNVNKAIDKGDYAKAYSLVDPYFEQHDKTQLRDASYNLNEKILKHEIASLVETDDNGDNAANIKFAIKERSKFNSYWASRGRDYGPDTERAQQSEMLKYALSLAKAAGNDALVNKLSQ